MAQLALVEALFGESQHGGSAVIAAGTAAAAGWAQRARDRQRQEQAERAGQDQGGARDRHVRAVPAT
jgi:hypothetical protein